MKTKQSILIGSFALASGLTLSAQDHIYAINAGGPAFTDADGIVYEADQYFTSGSTASTGATIDNTVNDGLYQSERYGQFGYDLPVENGNYRVTLKFAEIYFNSPNSRYFRASIEGAVDPRLCDIYSQAGGKNIAYDAEYTTTVTDGNLDIDFILGAQDLPKVSAILVTRISDETPDNYALYTGDSFSGPITDALGTVYQYNLSDYVVSGSTFVSGAGLPIANTTDDRIYQYCVASSESVEFGFPIQDGLYSVTLKLSENKYTVNAVGDRLFTVSLEGVQDPVPFDVFELAGGKYNAIDAVYEVEVSDGVLNLKLDKDAASELHGPMLNALSITRLANSYAINVGGGAYVDASGLAYQADSNFNGGSVASTSAPIANTDDDTLYQSERYGLFNYDLPIANGDYTVKLKFAEIYFNNSGERLFRVKNEGVIDILPLAIFSSAGGKNIAYDREYDVSVTDGELNIEMVMGQKDLPKLSAILVEPKSTVPSFYAINCGGSEFTDSNGITYQTDDMSLYQGTSTSHFSSAPISGTEDDALYQSQIIGSPAHFSYLLPIENGSYTVTLKFAKLDSVSGNSYFKTNAEGQQWLSFMPGANQAYDRTFSGVTVTDGVLDIEFDPSSGGGSPHVAAILVEKE